MTSMRSAFLDPKKDKGKIEDRKGEDREIALIRIDRRGSRRFQGAPLPSRSSVINGDPFRKGGGGLGGRVKTFSSCVSVGITTDRVAYPPAQEAAAVREGRNPPDKKGGESLKSNQKLELHPSAQAAWSRGRSPSQSMRRNNNGC